MSSHTQFFIVQLSDGEQRSQAYGRSTQRLHHRGIRRRIELSVCRRSETCEKFIVGCNTEHVPSTDESGKNESNGQNRSGRTPIPRTEEFCPVPFIL